MAAGDVVSDTISIVDNEPYSLSVTPTGDNPIAEGEEVVVTASLDRAYHAIGARSLPVSISYAVSSDAADADFTIGGVLVGVDGSGFPFSFGEGDPNEQNIRVQAIDDALDEGDETATITFTERSGFPVTIANPVLTFTIEAHGTAPTVTLSDAPATVTSRLNHLN